MIDERDYGIDDFNPENCTHPSAEELNPGEWYCPLCERSLTDSEVENMDTDHVIDDEDDAPLWDRF